MLLTSVALLREHEADSAVAVFVVVLPHEGMYPLIALGFVGGVDTVLDVYELGRSLMNHDWTGAAVAAVVLVIPGVGAHTGKALAKGLESRAVRELGEEVLEEGVERAVKKSVPTGQVHHPISTKVGKQLEEHPVLNGHYQPRDPRFTTRAIDEAAHRGYQRWHRDLDKEIVQWLKDPRNVNATPEQFESWLRWRYRQPDLLERFPDGF